MSTIHAASAHGGLGSRARAALARPARGEVTLGRLAQELATSPRQLQRTLRETGTSFRELHERARLSTAAELLAGQSIPVASVARLVGYRSPSGFARAFRRRYGLPPAAFRAAARTRAKPAPSPGRPPSVTAPRTAATGRGS